MNMIVYNMCAFITFEDIGYLVEDSLHFCIPMWQVMEVNECVCVGTCMAELYF